MVIVAEKLVHHKGEPYGLYFMILDGSVCQWDDVRGAGTVRILGYPFKLLGVDWWSSGDFETFP